MTVHNGNSKNTCTALRTKNLDFSKLALTGSYGNGSQHKLRLFRFLKRLLFSEEKKCNTAKSISWFTLLLTGLSLKFLRFFLRCIFLAIPGGSVLSYSSNTDPRPISDQYLLGKCEAVLLRDFLFTKCTLSIISQQLIIIINY